MSLETDLLLDRRRLKRRLSTWRIATVLAVLACVGLAVGRLGVDVGRHVARLSVSGIITEDRKLVEAITRAAKDSSVAAMIVDIDSPGGSVAGGESFHQAIKAVAAVKPVVTVMGGTAASAGYMIAVPAARIFAREATVTGSIGVILETGEVSGFLGKLGLSAEAITSGPLKDQPSYLHPTSPQGRDVLRALVMDMYDQFVGMVAEGRHMTEDQVRALADGRVYTGRQALKLGLIDAIGGEPEARAWLGQQHPGLGGLPVRDLKASDIASRTFGASLGGFLGDTLKTLFSQSLKLDGPVALWQPSGFGAEGAPR